MSLNSKEVGRAGENLVCERLGEFGLEFWARNVQVPGGEIDLIALSEEGDLVIAEIKCDRVQEFNSPALRVDLRKQRQIAKCASVYLQVHELPKFKRVRFDVFAVVLDQGEIKHYPDAFVPFLN